MSKALPGSLVSIYYDSPREIAPGDALETPSGRTYIIAEVRLQQRGKHIGRKHLKCIVSDGTMTFSGTLHPIYWYSRSRKGLKTRQRPVRRIPDSPSSQE